MFFKSKVDIWLAVVLLGAAFLPGLVIGVAFLLGAIGSTEALVIAGALCVPSLLILWIFFGTFYFVGDDQLVVRSGPVRVNVPFDSIRSIGLTRSVAAAPALSAERVVIVFGDYKRLLLSPDNRQAFIDAIKARAPRATAAA